MEWNIRISKEAFVRVNKSRVDIVVLEVMFETLMKLDFDTKPTDSHRF